VGNGLHAFADDAIHTREPDSHLVLQEFSHRTNTTVAEMIDVIRLTHTVLKADVVADYRENIFERQMMRDKSLAILGQKSLKRGGFVFRVFGFFNNLTQDRGVN